MNRKVLIDELKRYAGGGGVITKSQIARFYGLKHTTCKITDLVKDLNAINGKYYLVIEVAEEIRRRC